MAKYQKAENCGPVPYPDRSGKFLNAGETAEGDDWEPLVALGFVVKVAEAPAAAAPPPPPPAPVAPPAPPKIEEPKAATLQEEAPQEVNDAALQSDDGAGTEAMDPAPAGKSGDKGVSGRPSTGRRR